MKKTILFFLFIGITYFGKAQLTVSGTPNYSNTTNGILFTLGIVNTPLPSFPPQFTSDAGTNAYTRIAGNGTPTGSPYYYEIIVRLGGYWYIGNYGYFPNDPPSSARFRSLWYRTKNTSTSIDPPCFEIWESILYNQSTEAKTPQGNYFNVTMTGTTCLVASTSTTLLPNIYNLPVVSPPPTSPTPPIGSMVYDDVSGCVSVFNGATWNCLSQVNPTTVNYSGYVLSTFYNYILYTGAAGTMTIPPASTCPGREYNIINQGTGVITLNLPYYGAGFNTIPTATAVNLVAINGTWYKVN